MERKKRGGNKMEKFNPADSSGATHTERFKKPGLIKPDGTTYIPHQPNPVTGKTLDVTDFGAIPDDDDHDDVPAIWAAIEAAEAGDEVYFPNGMYQLKETMPDDPATHFHLKSKVNLRGESEHGVQLVSHLDMNEILYCKVMTSYGESDVTISNLTITSMFNGSYSTNPRENNPGRGGPAYVIFLTDHNGTPSSRFTIDQVTIEKYQRMGVVFEKSNRNIVQNCTMRKTTDVGGGGAGYGVSIQGEPQVDRHGYANDTYFNIVRNNTFEGPYIRHGTLIQYFAHNNLVQGNKYKDNVLDAIDLHGQREYLNEVCHNTIDGVLQGGIGVGNTGGTPPNNHSASGAGNYIHHNTLTNTRDGIFVLMGSPHTVIENNTIMNTTGPENAKGIYLLNAPGTIVRGNKILHNTAPGFWAIYQAEDFGDKKNDGIGAGIPDHITITDNKLVGNTNGIRIEAGTRLTLENNHIEKSIEVDYVNLVENTE